MYFFSDRHVYPECGLYSLGHFIYLAILFSLIILGLILSKNVSLKGIRKQTRIIAIIITTLEIIKIGYNHYYGYFSMVDCWVPLSFCALFLYTSWMSLSKNPFLSKMAQVWIAVGGLFGGFCFMLYPSTSLGEVQAFHFLAVQSLSYHAMMVYTALLYLIHGVVTVNLKNFKYYALFLGIIFSVVIIIDYAFHVNFMFLYNAYALPGWVQAVCSWCRPVYTLCVAVVHIIAPYFILFALNIIFDSIHKKNEAKEESLASIQ